MIILVLSKKEVDATYLKTLISDFHTKEHPNEVFEISALLLGLDQHLILIKTFQDGQESMEYYQTLTKSTSIKEFLKNSQHKIMPISFENFKEFYRNKDTEGYFNFFKQKYLTID